MSKTLFLMDGHSHCYQAFYAMAGRGFTSPDGQPVNAVYIFATMLRKILNDYRPEYFAAAFDEKGPTFRHGLYPAYKANREVPPDEFLRQVPLIKDLLRAHGIPIFQREGYEADDLIGTLARQARERGMEVCLLMTDKDARQLLGPGVSMLNARTGERLTAEDLAEKEGLRPEQVVDMMALAGDASDNVPGVPGVGPKTAARLIRQYGSLEEVLAHVDEMKQGRLKERLAAHGEQARLSRRLVTIDCHAPVTLDPEACRVRPDPDALRDLFGRLGFRSLLDGLGPARPTSEERDYRLVDTPESFESFLRELKAERRFAFDLETTSVHPVRAEIVGLAFSWRAKSGYYVPLRAPEGERTLEAHKVLAALKPILGSTRYRKVGQNLKYDAVCMLKVGHELRGIAFDTMLAAYCLDPTRRRYNLDDLALDYLDLRTTPISDLIGKGKAQRRMDEVPARRVCDYACEDADVALRLADLLEPKLREAECWDLYVEEELPLVEVLAHMEHHGIGFDPGALDQMTEEITARLRDLEAEIHREAGEPFNVASPKQLSRILFGKLGLPVVKKTRTGPSTDADVLSELAIEHRLALLVLEHRKLSKLLSTYVKVLPQEVLPETGCIHASFHQTATATGRLSSSDPNLQNIPIRTELGSRIRSAFVPARREHLMLAADYSQIELRILAHFSGDRELRRAFERGRDIHASVAAQIAGVRLAEVTPEQRRLAKAVNFGIVYGQTAYGLSRSLSIPVEEADGFIKAYFERYAGVKEFIERVLSEARERGYVTTLRGRRRYLPDLNASDRPRRSFAERAAVNTIIQGTAADMIKRAMIQIHRHIRKDRLKTRLVLQIHDELLFEVPPGEVPRVQPRIVEIMSRAEDLDVPIVVDVGVGRNWLEAK